MHLTIEHSLRSDRCVRSVHLSPLRLQGPLPQFPQVTIILPGIVITLMAQEVKGQLFLLHIALQ